MHRKASPTHPSLLKECQHRAWLYDLQLFPGENTATDDPFDHLFNTANAHLVVRVEMEQIIETT